MPFKNGANVYVRVKMDPFNQYAHLPFLNILRVWTAHIYVGKRGSSCNEFSNIDFHYKDTRCSTTLIFSLFHCSVNTIIKLWQVMYTYMHVCIMNKTLHFSKNRNGWKYTTHNLHVFVVTNVYFGIGQIRKRHNEIVQELLRV